MTHSEVPAKIQIKGNKIAILLPNPCNPDYRVIKHAECFARSGYDVRVYCRWVDGLPEEQVINDVTYIRRPITAKNFAFTVVKYLFAFGKKPVAKTNASETMNS